MNWTPEELQSLVDDHPLVLFMNCLLYTSDAADE